jgi:hypothetical protein
VVRWTILLAMLLLLVACIPRVPPPRVPGVSQPAASRQPIDAPETRQCLADLRREEIGFHLLPDRTFEGGCMAIGAVQLTEIGTPVTNLGAMTCPVARQFARWTREALQPAAQQWLGAPVRRIESFGTYACRPVNSQAGARLSEHAFANAVDIAAFQLADGRRITVLEGWNSEDERVRQFLRAAFQGGCRRFNIGIGPDGDAFHRDHFHFDMGRGPYCR